LGECFALDLRFAPGCEPAPLEALLYSALDDFEPLAIQEHESADGWLVFFSDQRSRDAALIALAGIPSLVSSRPLTVADEDWARRSQADLTAVTIGRITVAPPWDPIATAALDQGGSLHARSPANHGSGMADRGSRIPDTGSQIPDRVGDLIVIVIDPSMGFGTGHHQTTRLCLSLLQDAEVAGRRVLDIGTGSGVLALAAWRLGAEQVVAMDNDPDALQNAGENIARNGAQALIHVVRAELHDFHAEPADIVAANLTAAVLARHAHALRRLLKPGGDLIVSGFPPAELPDVLTALDATARRRVADGEWMAALISY
jgi:ribosomal protein L11 methyltransferase